MVFAILLHACLPKGRRRQGRLGPAAIRISNCFFPEPRTPNPRSLSSYKLLIYTGSKRGNQLDTGPARPVWWITTHNALSRIHA